jgi:hypothetical protein
MSQIIVICVFSLMVIVRFSYLSYELLYDLVIVPILHFLIHILATVLPIPIPLYQGVFDNVL